MRSVDLVSAPSAQRMVSVILPVFNEEDRLASTVAWVGMVIERDLPERAYEIVIVDDASSDRSESIANWLVRRFPGVRYVRHERNGGADAAVRTGVASANGEVIVVLDADLSYKPTIVRELIAPVLSENADIVLASAYAQGGAVRNVPLLRALMSRWANRYLAFVSRSRVRTFTCIVRAYSSEVARSVFAGGGSVHGVLFDALKRGYEIQEIPATLEWPGNRRSRMRLFATLRRTLDVLWSGIRFRPVSATPITLPKRRIAKYS